MKIRVTINEAPIQVDEEIQGSSEDDVFHKFRDGAAARAPFAVKLAMKAMSDQALREKIVGAYNKKFGASEPVPSSAKEFLTFGERAGYVKRL